MCPVFPTSNQDGRQAKNRKKGGWNFLKIFSSIKILFLLSKWFQTRRFLWEFPIGSYVKLSTALQPSWSEGGTTRNKFGSAVSEEKI
jgi:hypothetical protein